MGLRVLLVDDDAERAQAVRDGLEARDCVVAGHVTHTADLVANVRLTQAEVIVCDIDNPSRDTLEAMHALHRDEPRPVVMFVDRSDPERIAQAMAAGVAAYVIEGLSPDRVKQVIDVAVARFASHQALRAELNQVKSTLADRKLVERAKGILMQSRQMTEDEAFRALRRLAMQQGKRLGQIAAHIIALEQALTDRN